MTHVQNTIGNASYTTTTTTTTIILELTVK